MRDYGAVSPNFWTGATGKALRGDRDAQTVAMYLMTSPHSNMIGLYRCPITFCAEETGLGIEAASKGLQSLIEHGFCQYDCATDEVFVVTMARFQIADALKPNDNRCKSVRRELGKVTSTALRQAFHHVYAAAFHLGELRTNDGLAVRPIEAPSKPHRSQEQEQEQDHGQEQDKTPARDRAAGPADVDAVVWGDFVRHRRAPMTNTAVQELRSEAVKAGVSMEDAVRMAVKRGWSGFEAEWLRAAFGSGQKNASNRFSVTVPAASGKDPALAKIEADAARAVAPPAGFFSQVRAMMGGAKQ